MAKVTLPFNVFNDKLLPLNPNQFAETNGPVNPTRGKDVIYIVQPINATIGSDAFLPGQQTEGGWTVEGDILDEQTKTGRIVDYGTDTESIELTLYETEGDKGQVALREAKFKHQKIKVWRVVLPFNENGKHDTYFSYAVVESIETSESDSFVELTVSLQIDGQSQPGEINPLPIELIESAQYPFEKPGETGVPADDGNDDGSNDGDVSGNDDGGKDKVEKTAADLKENKIDTTSKELAQIGKDKK